MGKHTPGPWNNRGKNKFVIYGADGSSVAHAGFWADDCEEEATANAYLVAAAPDMLAALELAINSPHCGYAIDAMNKAVAKAKGEA